MPLENRESSKENICCRTIKIKENCATPIENQFKKCTKNKQKKKIIAIAILP